MAAFPARYHLLCVARWGSNFEWQSKQNDEERGEEGEGFGEAHRHFGTSAHSESIPLSWKTRLHSQSQSHTQTHTRKPYSDDLSARCYTQKPGDSMKGGERRGTL